MSTVGFPLQETSTSDFVLDRAGQEESDQQGTNSLFSQVKQKHSGIGLQGWSQHGQGCLVALGL